MISQTSARVNLARAYLFDLNEDFSLFMWEHTDELADSIRGSTYWLGTEDQRIGTRELRMTMLMGGPL